MARIELRNVSMTYGLNGTSTHALDSVSLEVDDGEFIALIGPSGCGKSTLLDLVAGLKAPTFGQVAVDGEQIRKPGPDRGIVFQDYSLFPWMSALENIRFALEHSSQKLSRKDSLPRAQKISGDHRSLAVRQQLSGHALGRHAPAPGHRSHVRHGPPGIPDGRALRRA